VGAAATVERGEAPPARPDSPEQALTFRVGGQVYALPLHVVVEVQQIVEFTPLPTPDPWVLGLVDVRGAVMPVYDLGQILGLDAVSRTLETPMLICRLPGGPACLVVEGVLDVVEACPTRARTAADSFGSVTGVLGAYRVGDDLVVMLDPQRLVAACAGLTLVPAAGPAGSQGTSADSASAAKDDLP
jgi:chemotaxis signal transduction protein